MKKILKSKKLSILPERKNDIENPSAELLYNVIALYNSRINNGIEDVIKSVRLLVAIWLTGLPVSIFKDGKIENSADEKLTNFIIDTGDYCEVQANRLLKLILKPYQPEKNLN